MKKSLLLFFVIFALILSTTFAKEPVKIIFDTDLGNDIDDTMALAVAHALEDRGELHILAVTTTKDNPLVAPVIDAVNTFYGRPDIPVGIVKNGVTPENGRYLAQVLEMKRPDGKPAFPRQITSETVLPEAVALIRKTLASQEDKSVVFVQLGFFTNLQRLLETPGDAYSPLDGRALALQKIKYVSVMAGAFGEPERKTKEYNVVKDLPASRKMIAQWPTEMIFSGVEIGKSIMYPVAGINEDYEYVPFHPVKVGYGFYRGLDKPQATYDLNSVLYAARPNRGYYTLSEPGIVSFTEEGQTIFRPDPQGKHRYQIVDTLQIAAVGEALVQLASEPPKNRQCP